jgi:D-tyrosyl-tRNA(Tyr) deacylase
VLGFLSIEIIIINCSKIQIENMRAVIQRVLRASVRVGDDLISSIDRGLCVLIGIANDDEQTDIDYIVKKLLAIRLWSSADGTRNWNRNVVDLDYSLLCVSQFTLHATLKGTKPDFHLSMSGEQSKIVYEKLLNQLKQSYKADKIFDGKFGAMMNVNIGTLN